MSASPRAPQFATGVSQSLCNGARKGGAFRRVAMQTNGVGFER
jgi:hypothetical protein